MKNYKTIIKKSAVAQHSLDRKDFKLVSSDIGTIKLPS